LAAFKAALVRSENQCTLLFGKRGTASTKAAADQFASKMLPVIREIQKEGVTSAAGIAAALNKRGITTARGKEWRNVQVAAVLARMAI
jgi:hypothetical protein